MLLLLLNMVLMVLLLLLLKGLLLLDMMLLLLNHMHLVLLLLVLLERLLLLLLDLCLLLLLDLFQGILHGQHLLGSTLQFLFQRLIFSLQLFITTSDGQLSLSLSPAEQVQLFKTVLATTQRVDLSLIKVKLWRILVPLVSSFHISGHLFVIVYDRVACDGRLRRLEFTGYHLLRDGSRMVLLLLLLQVICGGRCDSCCRSCWLLVHLELCRLGPLLCLSYLLLLWSSGGTRRGYLPHALVNEDLKL